jgi:hypothetical protein
MGIDKLWMGGAGFLVGAIAGGAIWGQRAAHLTNKAAEAAGGEDALIQTASRVGTTSLAAIIQGSFVGGIIGLVAVLAFLYFNDPDREMKVRKVHTGDDSA